jgi:signal peptidase II
VTAGPGIEGPGIEDPGTEEGAGVRRWILVAAVAAVVVTLDQTTKWWALQALDGARTIDVVWTLRLRLVFNRGTAFGLGSRFGPLIAVLAVVVVAVLARAGNSLRGRTARMSLGLVLGGAVGNLIDRLVRDGSGFLGGAVVDFIDLQWWPVFNVADMAITVGAVLLALTAWRDPGLEEPDETAAGARP